MINDNVMKLPFILVAVSGFLFSTDCYVDSNNIGFEDGSTSNPCQTIECCIGFTDNSSNDKIYLRSGEHIINNTINLERRGLFGESLNSTFVMSTKNDSYCDDNNPMLSAMIVVEYGAEIANITFQKYPGFGGHCYGIVISSTNNVNFPLIRNNVFESMANSKSIIGPRETYTNRLDVHIKNNYFNNSEQIFLRGINDNSSEIHILNNLVRGVSSFVNLSSSQNSDNFLHIHNNLFIDGASIGEYGIDQVSYNSAQYNSNAGQNVVRFSSIYGNDNELGWISDEDKLFEYNLFAFDPMSSILFDSGHPSSEFNDPDGSRGDIGLFGGDYSWATYGPGPVIQTFSIDPIIVPLDGTININARAITE